MGFFTNLLAPAREVEINELDERGQPIIVRGQPIPKGWRPPHEAPKDGEWIEVEIWNAGALRDVCRWNPDVWCYVVVRGGWQTFGGGYWSDMLMHHWRPYAGDPETYRRQALVDGKWVSQP